MSNKIFWEKPIIGVAITTVLDDVDLNSYAVTLKENGSVPADWVHIEGEYPIPENWPYIDDMRFLPGGSLGVDFDAAKARTKDRLRQERAPLLAALDVQYMQALEQKKSTTAIVTEKNRLRQITDAADTCTTIEQLLELHA